MSQEPGPSDSADELFGVDDIDALLDKASDYDDRQAMSNIPAADDGTDKDLSPDDFQALLGATHFDSIERETAAVAAEDSVVSSSGGIDTVGAAVDSPAARRPDLPNFEEGASNLDPRRVTMLNDVKLRVKIELGRTQMLVEDVLKLGEGSVVELDKLAGDPVDVYVNDRLVARGEVLVLNDNFCVRISDVISNDPHRISA